MTSHRSTGKRILASKILLLVSLFILIFFSVNLVKEIINRRDLQKDIDKLQAEIDGLDSRNEELADLIEYFKSMDFVENEARTKLNLRKPGEKIIIVPEEADLEKNYFSESVVQSELKKKSNPSKWWNYFFNLNL